MGSAVLRPVVGVVDIGAFESVAGALLLSAAADLSAGMRPDP